MLQDFINTYMGRTNVGDTDANTGECVGLVEVWLDTIGAPHIWGNACDLARNADGGSYTVTPNTTDYVPTPGDIGVLPAGWGGSSVGHTFIVAPGTDVHTLKVFEQNNRIGGGNGACRIYNGIGWPSGLVFIHPKVLDPAPVAPVPPLPSPAPTPAPTPIVVPVSGPDTTPAVQVEVVQVPAGTPSEPVPAAPEDTLSGDHTSPGSQSNGSSTPIVAPVNGVITVVSKYMSRKFLLTVLGIVVAIGGYVSGALSAGESLTSMTFLIGLFNVIEGLIDHKNAPLG